MNYLLPGHKLTKHVSQVRDYLATKQGHWEIRQMMVGFGWSYERSVGATVVKVTGLEVYEHVTQVTDEVILAELSSTVPGEVA